MKSGQEEPEDPSVVVNGTVHLLQRLALMQRGFIHVA
jgi:hypothetical protein